MRSPIYFPDSSVGKESAHYVGDLSSIPGLQRSPQEGKGYPLQYSGLENSIDCIVHGIAESQMCLSNFHFTFFKSFFFLWYTQTHSHKHTGSWVHFTTVEFCICFSIQYYVMVSSTSKLFENNLNRCLTPYSISGAKFNCVFGRFDFLHHY